MKTSGLFIRFGFVWLAAFLSLLTACGGGGSASGGSGGAYYANWYCTGAQCASVMGGYSGTAGPFSSATACEQWRQTYILTSTCSTTPGGGAVAPTISGFTPSSGAPGASVTITGANFATDSTVTLNGISATVVSATATQIVITIPVMSDITVPFVVTAPGGNVTSSGNFTVTTPGVNWVGSAATGVFRGVNWSGSLHVAAGDNIITSTDAASWAQRLFTLPIPTLYSVTYKGGRFVAVGVTVTSSCCFVGTPGGVRTTYSGTILVSDDGATWVSQVAGTPAILKGVTLSGSTQIISGPGSQYVAVGEGGVILTSTTGATWTLRTSGTGSMLNGIAWSSSLGKFATVGAAGVVLTSADGVNWSSSTSGSLNNLNSVAWCGNQFVAVGDAGTVLTSPEGVNWTTRSSGIVDALYGVACSASQIVAVGAGGSLRASSDGVNWVARTSGTTNTLYGITWTSGNTSVPAKFVVVGDNVTLTSQ